MAKVTIKEMIKEIFFDATNGQRSTENFAYGMYVIEHLKSFYYRPYWEKLYQEYLWGTKSSKHIMSDLEWDMFRMSYDSDSAKVMYNALSKFRF